MLYTLAMLTQTCQATRGLWRLTKVLMLQHTWLCCLQIPNRPKESLFGMTARWPHGTSNSRSHQCCDQWPCTFTLRNSLTCFVFAGLTLSLWTTTKKKLSTFSYMCYRNIVWCYKLRYYKNKNYFALCKAVFVALLLELSLAEAWVWRNIADDLCFPASLLSAVKNDDTAKCNRWVISVHLVQDNFHSDILLYYAFTSLVRN